MVSQPPSITQSILELLALLLPVAAAFLQIMLRSADREPDEYSFLRSVTFFSVSFGILALIGGAWILNDFIIRPGFSSEINTTLQLVVLGLTAIAGPMALVGIYAGIREFWGSDVGEFLRSIPDRTGKIITNIFGKVRNTISNSDKGDDNGD